MAAGRVNKWDAELLALAGEATKALPPASGGDFISFAQGIIKVGGAAVPGNKIDVIVLDFVAEHQYYEGAYNPNAPESPSCYAFGNDPKTIKPHDAAVDPKAASCATCHLNEWGSDPNGGKGKACKNVMRLALIVAEDAKDAKNAEVKWAKIPVMSVANFAAYATQLGETLQRPPLGVVTRITAVPDPKSQFRVLFECAKEVDDAFIGDLIAKRKTLKMDFPYPERQAAPTPALPAAGRFAGSARNRKLG